MNLPEMNRPEMNEEELLCIPLPEKSMIQFGVFFRRGNRSLPNPEVFSPVVYDWIARHAADPLQDQLRHYILQGRLVPRVLEARDLPRPARQTHCPRGLDVHGEGEFRQCDTCVLLLSRDSLKRPRTGLWAALAAGRALAGAFNGFLHDYGTGFFCDPRSHLDDLPARGEIAVVEHIRIIYSVDERGLGWITTTGMGRFGLPNLELREAPPDITPGLGTVLNGVAQRLVIALMDFVDSSTVQPAEVFFRSEWAVGTDDIALARGEEARTPAASVPIRMQYPGVNRDAAGPFITLCPPGRFRGRRGAVMVGHWTHVLMRELVAQDEDVVVPLCREHAEIEAMERAHRKALSHLPEVKQRFQNGLRPGESLLVKHGFPRGDVDGGLEFMWVAVNTWRGNRLQGQLTNQPRHRLDLKPGDPIELSEPEVYDWAIERADGTYEGGYTTIVLKKMLGMD